MVVTAPTPNKNARETPDSILADGLDSQENLKKSLILKKKEMSMEGRQNQVWLTVVRRGSTVPTATALTICERKYLKKSDVCTYVVARIMFLGKGK